ncbi:MAG: PGPGW domain-containing protein [Gammaproteobacteria bacterium]
MAAFFDWISANETAAWWFGAISMLTFVGTLVAIPLLVARIPSDYFVRRKQHLKPDDGHPALRLIGLTVKNVAGAIFVLAGVAMLVLPGQGIITILIGLMLMNFPGKIALELWIIKQAPVLKAINWMRGKAGKPALEIPLS